MAGDIHFYSRSPFTPPGYMSEGVACYVFDKTGPGRVPLHRFVNLTNGSHFYSLSATTPGGYKAEPDEGFVLASPQLTPLPSTPFFRFYKSGSDNHFYQTSAAVPGGYVPEGQEGHVFTPAVVESGVTPLYRFFNPSSGLHFYTAASAATPAGYYGEGVAGYVFKTGGPGRTQLFRFVNVYNGSHFYSVNPTVPSGYVLEGEQIFVLAAPTSGSAPLSRFYNPKSDDHFYQTNAATPAGYVAEGNEGHVMLSATPGLVPLYRYYMPKASEGSSFLGDLWDTVTEVAGDVVDIVTGAVGAVMEVVATVLGVVLWLPLFILDLAASIPYVGRLFDFLGNWLNTIAWILVGLGDGLLSLIGIRPQKKLRLTVVIQKDESGEPVCRIEDVVYRINRMIEVFKQANVTVIPAHAYSPKYGSGFIVVEDSISDADTLDVNGASDGSFGKNLGKVGSKFHLKMAQLGVGANFQRLSGYAVPLVVFAVRRFMAGQRGTSLGPTTNFVLVDFNTADVTTVAHEAGHACMLGHRPDEADNLMFTTAPRGDHLTGWQITAIRMSPHVTYL